MAIVWTGHPYQNNSFTQTHAEIADGPVIYYGAYDTIDSNYSTNFAISGGADKDLFELRYGALVIKDEYLQNYRGYETPLSIDGDNTLDVTLYAHHQWFSWNTNSWVETEGYQSYSVTVTDVRPYATPGLQYGTFQISEDAQAGDAVKWLYGSIGNPNLVIDGLNLGDGTGPATLTLSDSVGGRFALRQDGTKYYLEVANAALLDRETNGDARYTVAIDVSDGTTAVTQTYDVVLFNKPPTGLTDIDSAAASIIEHSAVGTVVGVTAHATDPHGGTITYSFDASSGYNWKAGAFSINATTGVITVANSSLLNYETMGSSVTLAVKASDPLGASTSTEFTIAVEDKNDAPALTGSTSFSVAENGPLLVGTVGATDEDKEPTLDTLTLSLGGNDAAFFTLSSNGELRFNASPDFEAKADYNHDNVYSVTLTASDGALATSRDLSVSVTNVNEAPVITSSSGSPLLITRPEQTPASEVLHTFAVADPENGHISYSIGGSDWFMFDIDDDGKLRFWSPPDFSSPDDVGGNNVYDIVVRMSDGSYTVEQQVAITVTDVGPLIPPTTPPTEPTHPITPVPPVITPPIVTPPVNPIAPATSGSDMIVGTAGNDRLSGGVGRDTLTGGRGPDSQDQFAFDAPVKKGNLDTITDFESAYDQIFLDDAFFKGLGKGTPDGTPLKKSMFAANKDGEATSDGAQIVYETDTGKLFYDKDGEDGAKAVQFALLAGKPKLSYTDFEII